MKIKWIICIICLLSYGFPFAQAEEYMRTGNVYYKYSDCHFESEFKSTDKTISAHCDTIQYGHNTLGSSFMPDSTYHIEMNLFQKNGSAVYSQWYNFSGKYRIDKNNRIHLQGKHPFDSDIIRMREKKHKKHTSIRGYKFRLNNRFKETCRKKYRTFCDGNDEIPKSTDRFGQ